MWSPHNPFYLSATRFTTQRHRRRGEEGRKKKKKKKKLQVQAWRGEDEYHSRILATKALRRATRVLYLSTARDTGARESWRSRNVSVWVCVTRNILCSYSSLQYVCSPKCALKDRSMVSGGWGNVRYLCNYELNRVWSWSSESWTWISICSPLTTQRTPPNTS